MVRGLFIVLSCLLAAGPCGARPQAPERNLKVVPAAKSGDRRLALVIGNAAYAEAPLRNPVNDARAMAAALQEAGFEVTLLENADLEHMSLALDDFGVHLREGGGTGLFYFAGHGLQVQGENYLVPVGARMFSEAEVRFRTLQAGLVLAKLQDAGNILNIVILDACRNNPFARSWRGLAGGLASMDAPKGTLIAYATAPGQTAADGAGDNGLYTKHLLKAIAAPGLTVENVFKRVRGSVAEESGDKQVPWENTSLTGDFYFHELPPAPVLPPRDLVAEARTKEELALWETLKDVQDRAAFEDYLAKFPDGHFTTDARLRVEEIRDREELGVWNSLKDAKDRAAFEGYLARYPQGHFSGAARLQLEQIRDREELDLWNRIKDTQDRAILEGYLTAYPGGHFVGAARLQLEQIRGREELELWNRIKDAQDRAALENYLAAFPNGHFVGAARLQLEQFRDREELGIWNGLKDSVDAAVLEGYLAKYPEGHFVGAAKLRLEELRAVDELRAKPGLVTVKVAEAAGQDVVLLAGDLLQGGSREGIREQARFGPPTGLECSPDGRILVADGANAVIRMLDPSGRMALLAGAPGQPGAVDGPRAQARFQRPAQLLLLPSGDLLVADPGASAIRRITPAGQVDTFAGRCGQPGYTNGDRREAQFLEPTGLATDGRGNIYVADSGNHVIRKINPMGVVNTYVGRRSSLGASDGRYADARFNRPTSLAAATDGNIYVLDAGNSALRKVDLDGRVVTVALPQKVRPAAIASRAEGGLWLMDADGARLFHLDPKGGLHPVAELKARFDPGAGPCLRDPGQGGPVFTAGPSILRLGPQP